MGECFCPFQSFEVNKGSHYAKGNCCLLAFYGRYCADRGLPFDANVIADGKRITTGQRIRELFYQNVKTMALLMENREKCLKEPGKKSLLAGVEINRAYK